MSPRPERAFSAEDLSAARTSVAALSHDVRNILAALSLYCDLLSEPEVLAPQFQHYSQDLRLIANTGGALLERLTSLTNSSSILTPSMPRRRYGIVPSRPLASVPDRGLTSEETISNVREELECCGTMLSALAGPSISVEVDCQSYAGPLPITSEDLTRVLINLVRNASEAMPAGGTVRITVTPKNDAADGTTKCIVIGVEDNGPGIAADDIGHLFESGFSTKRTIAGKTSWLTPESHGLGLAIVRSMVQAVGGSVQASSPKSRGARFEIMLPLTSGCEATTKDVEAIEHSVQQGSRVQC